MTTAWYGKSSSKQLQQLLQTRPTIVQLLNFPDFVQQLKSYNTKLLDYITNNPYLILQSVQLITKSPSLNDSNDRKFKYPLQVIQIIETQTTCILNSFFKQPSPGKQLNVDALFNILHQNEILPILAGYFFRTNVCLLNNRYKQTLDRVYLRPQILAQFLNHSHLMPVVNTFQLYLNLDINKSTQSSPERLQVKKSLIRSILSKIDQQRKYKRADSAIIIENLLAVLIQTIQKYYLILDGKVMIEILTMKEFIDIMLNIIKEDWEGAYPAFNFFISLINYYSFSSFNSDETDPEKKAKNLERLEAQEMIIQLNKFFPIFLDRIMKANPFTLFEYKLLEILCHCISISSEEIFKTIKQTKFFGCLISLLFKHQENNILHMLIEKSFLHVFISERKIYEHYKRHLFCELDIIDLTASRVLSINSEDKVFDELKKKSFFGHFMRILKIYSGIQTLQQSIINSIKAKTDVWNKISSTLIKPYEIICFKQLGSYDTLPEGKYQQFDVKRSTIQSTMPQSNPKPLSRSMIQQISKQNEFLPSIKQKDMTSSLPEPIKQQMIHQKKKQQQLLKAPTHNLAFEVRANSKLEQKTELKKPQTFQDFMSKRKVQAEKQIKLKRSLSNQGRLSGSKGKITNSSPKRNNWTQKEKDKQSKLSLASTVTSTTPRNPELPRIPHHAQRPNQIKSTTPNTKLTHPTNSYRSYHLANLSPHSPKPNNSNQQNSINLIPSPEMLETLKKIKVIQIQTPKEKKYRRLQSKDKFLLDFLGIPTKLTK